MRLTRHAALATLAACAFAGAAPVASAAASPQAAQAPAKQCVTNPTIAWDYKVQAVDRFGKKYEFATDSYKLTVQTCAATDGRSVTITTPAVCQEQHKSGLFWSSWRTVPNCKFQHRTMTVRNGGKPLRDLPFTNNQVRYAGPGEYEVTVSGTVIGWDKGPMPAVGYGGAALSTMLHSGYKVTFTLTAPLVGPPQVLTAPQGPDQEWCPPIQTGPGQCTLTPYVDYHFD